MKIIKPAMTIFVILYLTTGALAAMKTFTDETAYLDAISAVFKENFDGPEWDGVRTTPSSDNASTVVASNGITWSTAAQISTSQGPSRSGWAVFSSPHTIPDTIKGVSATRLYGVGGWFKTNTPPAKIQLILDENTIVDFSSPIIDTQHAFFGVIRTEGFYGFEFMEVEGTTIEPRLLFGDDFSLALALSASGGNAADDGYLVTPELWTKAVLNVPGNPVTLSWREVGTDTTPSGDRVISGYFYANPTDFAYGSIFNPEVFVKIFIAGNGWANIAFNHVTVDDVRVYSAHHYHGVSDMTGSLTLNNRLMEHQYSGVSLP